MGLNSQAQSFVDSKKSYDMPSSWRDQYHEPKFLTDTYVSMRRPVTSKEKARPRQPPSISTLGISLPSASSTDVSQSSSTSKYDSRYLGGVASSQIGLSSDSYYRLERKFVSSSSSS